MSTKLYRASTTVDRTAQNVRTPYSFTDWYEANSEAEARELWDEDCHRYGLPMDKTTVVFAECDQKTFKPIDHASTT